MRQRPDGHALSVNRSRVIRATAHTPVVDIQNSPTKVWFNRSNTGGRYLSSTFVKGRQAASHLSRVPSRCRARNGIRWSHSDRAPATKRAFSRGSCTTCGPSGIYQMFPGYCPVFHPYMVKINRKPSRNSLVFLLEMCYRRKWRWATTPENEDMREKSQREESGFEGQPMGAVRGNRE